LAPSSTHPTTPIRRRRLVEGAQEPLDCIGGDATLELAHEDLPRRQEVAVARPTLAERGGFTS
jgi:hypothetical protein